MFVFVFDQPFMRTPHAGEVGFLDHPTRLQPGRTEEQGPSKLSKAAISLELRRERGQTAGSEHTRENTSRAGMPRKSRPDAEEAFLRAS